VVQAAAVQNMEDEEREEREELDAEELAEREEVGAEDDKEFLYYIKY